MSELSACFGYRIHNCSDENIRIHFYAVFTSKTLRHPRLWDLNTSFIVFTIVDPKLLKISKYHWHYILKCTTAHFCRNFPSLIIVSRNRQVGPRYWRTFHKKVAWHSYQKKNLSICQDLLHLTFQTHKTLMLNILILENPFRTW